MGLYFRFCRTKRSSLRPSSSQPMTPQGENACDPCSRTIAEVTETIQCRRRHPQVGENEEVYAVPTERSRLTPTSSQSPLTREEV